jgi:hypothetical integral membrane protein (TIGR02206 family)
MFLFDDRYEGFQMFSLQHLAAIIFLVFIVFLLVKYKDLFKNNPKLDKTIRFGMAFTMLGLEIVFWVWSIRTFGFEIGLLPFGLCAMSLHLSIITLIFDQKKLFKLIYPWTITGAILSLGVADMNYQFPHFRYIHYFGNHSLFFLSSLYYLQVKNVKIVYKDILISSLLLFILTIPISIINFIFDGNHLFLRSLPTDIDFLFYWMGPLWILGFMVFIFGLFNLWYLPLRKRML